MADIVLVLGAWHGSWCWRRVVPLLWLAGHRVLPVTLTGLGERAHQLSPEITLGTHVDDVVTAMRAEECSRAVLVGHSYGGLVVTGAADRLRVEVDQPADEHDREARLHQIQSSRSAHASASTGHDSNFLRSHWTPFPRFLSRRQ